MALRRTNNTKTSKFCKFCKSAGKSHSEYTSHYPKDQPGPKGKVICPTILSTECSYCHAIGHAKNHCPKLNMKNNTFKYCVRVNKRVSSNNHMKSNRNMKMKFNNGCYAPKKREKMVKPIAFQNRYSMLMEADIVKDTVALPTTTKPIKKATGSWAKPLSSVVKEEKPFMVAKYTVPVNKEYDDEINADNDEINADNDDNNYDTKVLKELFKSQTQTPQVLWGDMSSDSESDSDYDE